MEPMSVAHVGVSVCLSKIASAIANRVTMIRPTQITKRFGSHTYPPLLPPLLPPEVGAWPALAQITKPKVNPSPHQVATAFDSFANSQILPVSRSVLTAKLPPRSADTTIKHAPVIERAATVGAKRPPMIPATAPAAQAAMMIDENGMSSRRGLVTVVTARFKSVHPTTTSMGRVEAAASIQSCTVRKNLAVRILKRAER